MLDNASAALVCGPLARHAAGDRTGVVGQVNALRHGDLTRALVCGASTTNSEGAPPTAPVHPPRDREWWRGRAPGAAAARLRPAWPNAACPTVIARAPSAVPHRAARGAAGHAPARAVRDARAKWPAPAGSSAWRACIPGCWASFEPRFQDEVFAGGRDAEIALSGGGGAHVQVPRRRRAAPVGPYASGVDVADWLCVMVAVRGTAIARRRLAAVPRSLRSTTPAGRWPSMRGTGRTWPDDCLCAVPHPFLDRRAAGAYQAGPTAPCTACRSTRCSRCAPRRAWWAKRSCSIAGPQAHRQRHLDRAVGGRHNQIELGQGAAQITWRTA